MTTDTPAGLAALLHRRSASALTQPGPTDAQLALLLEAATTVPDHGALHPWRFVVVRDEARASLGDALAADATAALGPGNEGKTSKIRGKAFVAPTMIVLVASPQDSAKVPTWEQVCSASCTGYAIALAADDLGLGAVWKTAPYLSGPALSALLALQPDEVVLGWINVGTRRHEAEPERLRVDVSAVSMELGSAGLRPFVSAPRRGSP